MPIEYTLLKDQPLKFEHCPKCGACAPDYMRGQVQRSKRKWFKDRLYCAVICHECKEIVGWEAPLKILQADAR